MGLLEVPLQLSRIEAQRQKCTRKQIDACTFRAVAVRIPDCHIEQTQFRIDRRRLPDASAVAFAANPRGTCNLPTLVLFVLRNRVEVPQNLARLRIDGQHVSSWDVTLAAGAA